MPRSANPSSVCSVRIRGNRLGSRRVGAVGFDRDGAEDARRDDEWTAAAFEQVAEELDGREVDSGRIRHSGEVVDERGVDDAVDSVRTRTQTVEVGDVASLHLRTGSGDLLGGRLRTCQADDLMTCGDEFGRDRRADPAGCTGDENTHEDLRESVMSVAVIKGYT